MLDRTVFEKLSHELSLQTAEDKGYFAATQHLPASRARALDGVVIARANELCFSYEDLLAYLQTPDSQQLVLSVARGLKAMDYSKLPS